MNDNDWDERCEIIRRIGLTVTAVVRKIEDNEWGRFADVGKIMTDKLNRDNIHKMSNGHECFKIEQQKTETKVIIPILPQAREILEKYDYNIPKVIANQKFNEFLKEVARLAGLDDEVTITHTQINEDSKKAERVTQRFAKWECVTAHTARRSFATNMYKRDFPTLMIMAITGHKSESAFLKYIKVTEEENAERMMEKFMQQSKLY